MSYQKPLYPQQQPSQSVYQSMPNTERIEFNLQSTSFGQPSQNNFLQELLKMQQSPSVPQQQPVFGQGFLNAAQILANLQQMQQPQGPQMPSFGMMNEKPSHMLASNLNQYQNLIDQIEKQGMLS